MQISSMPESSDSSPMIWMTGLVSPSRSTSGNISFCTALDAGYCRVPRPAAVMTAFRTLGISICYLTMRCARQILWLMGACLLLLMAFLWIATTRHAYVLAVRDLDGHLAGVAAERKGILFVSTQML